MSSVPSFDDIVEKFVSIQAAPIPSITQPREDFISIANSLFSVLFNVKTKELHAYRYEDKTQTTCRMFSFTVFCFKNDTEIVCFSPNKFFVISLQELFDSGSLTPAIADSEFTDVVQLGADKTNEKENSVLCFVEERHSIYRHFLDGSCQPELVMDGVDLFAPGSQGLLVSKLDGVHMYEVNQCDFNERFVIPIVDSNAIYCGLSYFFVQTPFEVRAYNESGEYIKSCNICELISNQNNSVSFIHKSYVDLFEPFETTCHSVYAITAWAIEQTLYYWDNNCSCKFLPIQKQVFDTPANTNQQNRNKRKRDNREKRDHLPKKPNNFDVYIPSEHQNGDKVESQKLEDKVMGTMENKNSLSIGQKSSAKPNQGKKSKSGSDQKPKKEKYSMNASNEKPQQNKFSQYDTNEKSKQNQDSKNASNNKTNQSKSLEWVPNEVILDNPTTILKEQIEISPENIISSELISQIEIDPEFVFDSDGEDLEIHVHNKRRPCRSKERNSKIPQDFQVYVKTPDEVQKEKKQKQDSTDFDEICAKNPKQQKSSFITIPEQSSIKGREVYMIIRNAKNLNTKSLKKHAIEVGVLNMFVNFPLIKTILASIKSSCPNEKIMKSLESKIGAPTKVCIFNEKKYKEPFFVISGNSKNEIDEMVIVLQNLKIQSDANGPIFRCIPRDSNNDLLAFSFFQNLGENGIQCKVFTTESEVPAVFISNLEPGIVSEPLIRDIFGKIEGNFAVFPIKEDHLVVFDCVEDAYKACKLNYSIINDKIVYIVKYTLPIWKDNVICTLTVKGFLPSESEQQIYDLLSPLLRDLLHVWRSTETQKIHLYFCCENDKNLAKKKLGKGIQIDKKLVIMDNS